jgi:hypothetical protein
LETQGLAAAGGQEGEDIAPREVGVHDFTLERAKAVVTEGEAERVEEFGQGASTKENRRPGRNPQGDGSGMKFQPFGPQMHTD